MKIMANGKELSLPKMTNEQLNAVFGQGNWQIVAESTRSSLLGLDKYAKLGIGEQDARAIIALVQQITELDSQIREILKKNGLGALGTGYYIQNKIQEKPVK